MLAPRSKAKGRAFPTKSSILKTKPPGSQRSDGDAFVSVSGRLWQTSTKKAPRYSRKLWMERREKAHPLSNQKTPRRPHPRTPKERIRQHSENRVISLGKRAEDEAKSFFEKMLQEGSAQACDRKRDNRLHSISQGIGVMRMCSAGGTQRASARAGDNH